MSAVGSDSFVDIGMPGNALANQGASRSTHLEQLCLSLRARLLNVKGFQKYFDMVQKTGDTKGSTDAVTELWDVFSLGISLCYIFDLLPDPFPKINNSQFDQDRYEANPDREKRRAIALLARQLGTTDAMTRIPGLKRIDTEDLWDRTSTTGLTKIIETVLAILDLLPVDAYEESFHQSTPRENNTAIPGPVDTSIVAGPPEVLANDQRHVANVLRELVETERKYVRCLETLQIYANELDKQKILEQDTIHQLFPGIDGMLDFHQQLLVQFEAISEQPPSKQRLGQCLVNCEDGFSVCVQYCTQSESASDLLVYHEADLVVGPPHWLSSRTSSPGHFQQLNGLVDLSDLRHLRVYPLSRYFRYPMFFSDLTLATIRNDTGLHLEDLRQGHKATNRVCAKVAQEQRQVTKQRIIKALTTRVVDWKGHQVETFGELLLWDTICVTLKSQRDRDYWVLLFDKIILCLREDRAEFPKTWDRRFYIQTETETIAILVRDTPLLLRGRIFTSDVAETIPLEKAAVGGLPHYPGHPSAFSLQMSWKANDGLKDCTFRYKHKYQLEKWEKAIKEAAGRHNSD
ncbi:Dbl homology domain-containing protein [Coprinopsis sp. MPI-PUGE-AT-0042]|nr:Dbl homology domain-containing protein [Coprinopsis sp. MPI-PUGE-AT-0042]